MTKPGARWYLGSMNDGLFIINTPPRPSTDDVWHDRPDGPTMVLNVVDLSRKQAMAIVEAHNAALPSESAKKAGVVGWLFLNPDSGYEFSPNHPVESGECEDAENIRPATAKALLDELLSAWDAAHEFEGQLDQIARESASQRKALIDAEDALASIAGERTPKKFPQTSYEIAAKVLPAVRAVLPASPSPATGEA